ncbi:MAG: ATP-binding protein [Alphaproteobacteria bacterium]
MAKAASQPHLSEGMGTGLLARWRLLGRCRLCLRVALALFLSILVVEAVILVPSYRNHERDLLHRVEEVGQAALVAALNARRDDELLTMLAAVRPVVGRHSVLGGSLQTAKGLVLARFGAAPPPSARGRRGQWLDAYWPETETGLPVALAVRFDISHIEQELDGYVWRIAALVLLISVCVSVIAVNLMGRLVLNPMLDLRAVMRAARDDPAHADNYKVEVLRDDEVGEAQGALNDLLDSVARVRRDDLRAGEERFRDFADSASDWFWEMDDQLRFSYFSPRFEAITGVPPANLLGKRREESGVAKMVNPEVFQRHLDDLHSHRPFRNFVHPRILADGSKVWLSINGKPVFDAEGIFKGFRGSGADITERVAREAALKAARDEAQSANRAKSEFLAMMSHELRTPLNAIIGFSEVIRDQLFGSGAADRYQDYAGDIHASATHLLDLLNDILDLSKLEAGKVELHEEPCDIALTVEGALRLVRDRAEQGEVTLAVDGLDGLPPVIVDERRIKQVFLNLLSNAVKFTPQGGRVDIAGALDETGALVVTVVDTGIGIADADIPRALAPFGQIDSELARRYEGTGLGLPLTRSLLELHDGELRIDSQVGNGTRMSVVLPASRIVHDTGAVNADVRIAS